MIYVLGIAAVGVLAYAWLSGEEQAALNSYNSSSRRLAREVTERQQQLNSYRRASHAAHDFYKHNDLYYNSVLTANNCFALYDEQKKMLKMIQGRVNDLIQQIIVLKQQRDAAKGEQKAQFRQLLSALYESLDQAKSECAKIRKQKKALLSEVREINHKTRELKLYMRDNCGKKGRDWYQGHLERRSA